MKFCEIQLIFKTRDVFSSISLPKNTTQLLLPFTLQKLKWHIFGGEGL